MRQHAQASVSPRVPLIPCVAPALLVGAIFLAGCGEAPAAVPATDAQPLVTDTTGLHIANDSAPDWGASTPWTIGVAPSLDIGPPAQALLGVSAPVWLSDGRIVVSNASRQEILYFSPTGKLLLTAGGRGIDPGQFHGLGWIGRAPGDTIVAYDFVANSLALFDPKGKFVRGAKIAAGGGGAGLDPLANYPDGSLLVRIGGATSPFPGKPGTVMRDSATYLRVGLDGSVVATLGTFPQSESFGVSHTKGGAVAPFPVPFGLVTAAALYGDTLLLGTGTRFEIAAFGPSGAPVGLLRAAIPRSPVTPAEKEAFTTSAITRLRTASNMMQTALDTTLLTALTNAPFPADRPAFGRLVVDATGALWVSGPITPPQPPTNWNVFAPDGTWLGSVTTPEGFRVDAIGQDAMLGVWRATHGEERVQVYPVFRGAGS
jgi:hypothetical protein